VDTPWIDIFMSRPPWKKPMGSLAGDQNTPPAPSVPTSSRASHSSSRCRYSRPHARNTIVRPSGEITGLTMAAPSGRIAASVFQSTGATGGDQPRRCQTYTEHCRGDPDGRADPAPHRQRLTPGPRETTSRHPLERALEIACALPPVVGFLDPALADDILESGRREWLKVGHGPWLVVQHGADHAGGTRAVERACAGRHLVERGAEPPDVRARIHLAPALDLLGRRTSCSCS
jgi:hypothetical protein